MWGKIDDNTYFTCGNCGQTINPYTLGCTGLSPELAFHWVQTSYPCPSCNETFKWEYLG